MEALLVVDIQPETVRPRSAESYIGVWNKIIEGFSPDAVAYVANLRPFSRIPGSSPFAEGLDIVSDNVFYKRVPDAFSNPGLDGWLKSIGADAVRIIGIDGNWCIKATALGAVKHGYEARVIRSAVSSKNSKAFEERTVETLLDRGVIVE